MSQKTVARPKNPPPSCWGQSLFPVPFLIASILLFIGPAPLPAQPAYSPGEILVKLRPSAPKPAALQDLALRHGLQSAEPLFPPRPGRSKPAGPPAFARVYRLRIRTDPRNAAEAYATHPDVVYAQPNYLYRPLAAPNDPRYTDQTNLAAIGWQDLRENLGPVRRQVIIAIVDSGVDYTHEDLADNIWTNPAEAGGRPGIDDDGNGYVDDIRGWDFTDAPDLPGKGDHLVRDNDPLDESGHGTHVAGIAAAVADNAVGIAGIAPDARLMVLRAGATLQSGASFLQSDDLAAAILYAVENGAHILNMSWGSVERSFLIRDAVRYAAENGVLLVASAGNAGEPGLFYPAACTETIAVGATDRNDLLAGFSSTGQTLDLTAPGVNILSTLPGNTYGPRSGSSISAPHVSGLAALLLSRRPDLTPEQVRTLLSGAAFDLAPPGWDESFGAGRIDARSLQAALTPAGEPPTVQILAPRTDAAAETAFDVVAQASGEGLTAYRISWGLGRSPESWTALHSGQPAARITFRWDVSALPDSAVILRLEADVEAGRTLEDRARVAVRRSPPKIVSLRFGPELDGPRLVYRVRWSTDRPAEGRLLFLPFGAITEDTLSSSFVDRFQTVTLPDSLPAGPLSFRILARGPAGHTALSPPETFPYFPFRVPQDGYGEIATLPDGFLSDRPADFNGNGQQEIVLMPYIEGRPFSPVSIYEWQPSGAFQEVFQSASGFLPWTFGDADGDGRSDLLGTEFARLRIFSGNSVDPFPGQQILDLEKTWSGEIADLDGDGQNEILARSADDRGIRVLKRGGDGAFAQAAFLPDPTPGSGQPGPRFVVADFDGDSRNELLVGDADGDLWIYEARPGGVYTSTWKLEGDDTTDARWVGGGIDLDGDGRLEFVVARAFPEEGEAINGHWSLEVYSASGPDTYTLEWSTLISGVIPTGNGIATGDLDGDGEPDLVVCLRPDLYAFRSDGPDLYRPVFHARIGLTHRPLIADFDRDGRPEILFNRDGAVRILERQGPPLGLISPQILSAHPLGVDRARLTWMATPEASTYRLYRGGDAGPLALLADNLTRTAYIDTGLTENRLYHYRVAAVLPGGGEVLSDTAAVRPNPPPELTRIHTLGSLRLSLTFNEPMHPDTAEPEGYSLSGIGRPTSALQDREGRRILLTFPTPLASGTVYTLSLRNAADTSGVPLDPRFQTATFTPGAEDPALVQRADFDGDATVAFADFLLFARAFGSSDPTFDLDGDATVAFGDFLLFASVFGQRVGPKIG